MPTNASVLELLEIGNLIHEVCVNFPNSSNAEDMNADVAFLCDKAALSQDKQMKKCLCTPRERR
jgi:hypothetical protein